MKKTLATILSVVIATVCISAKTNCQPLPEHPRPDAQRAEWINLNGQWSFTFNDLLGSKGIAEGAIELFDKNITVPFPWGSKLSGVEDLGDKAWYGQKITIPESWEGKRIFLVVGASDWKTDIYFEGEHLTTHEGGYVPFEAELTALAKPGSQQTVVICADDTSNNAHLYGKQGYGNARGIWQTVYLEARGDNYVNYAHFSPDVDNSKVKLEVALDKPLSKGEYLKVSFRGKEQNDVIYNPKGSARKSTLLTFDIALENQRLWDIDNPYLYEMTASICSKDGSEIDALDTYFGQRKISVVNLPGTDYPYVALNDKPIYLQLCLDQSYHPEGFYTFPSDEFMRDEILISKNLGLNGNRIHIKVEVPRKLYWADRLGLLIMADVPNFWGEPVPEARQDWENCMRAQVKRDYNHPSIFCWVDFNETWGLQSNTDEGKVYTKQTQEWVREMYHATKALDPTRLVEDNSPCNHDHVETDINSWHSYRQGFTWESFLSNTIIPSTYPGSEWNYIGGNTQDGDPMINSECGNVWGYKDSTGDCDFTWDYHLMMNAFRLFPQMAGWLYTEHHDVINEWNGYVRYDRSPKYDGLGEIVDGMSINDFHSKYYIIPHCNLGMKVNGGSTVEVPMVASFMTDENPGKLSLKTTLVGYDYLGAYRTYAENAIDFTFEPYMNKEIGTVKVDIPSEKGLYILQTRLYDAKGNVLHRNFTTFSVEERSGQKEEGFVSVPFMADSFTASQWSEKQWNLEIGKVNAAGHGWYEYSVDIPQTDFSSAKLILEASAKELFAKDLPKDDPRRSRGDGDYMLGARENLHANPNSYSMTDDEKFESWLEVYVNDVRCGIVRLDDDSADHRGILSWIAQPNDRTMCEAGSYGKLIEVSIPKSALKAGSPAKIRLQVPKWTDGGLAIYGSKMGRYPVDPVIVLTK